MRISDWSSDVCSSDLQPPRNGDNQFVARDGAKRFMDATETDEINRQYRILIAGFAFHFRASRIAILDKSRAIRQAGQTFGHQLAAQLLFRLPLARSINDLQEPASDSVRMVGQISEELQVGKGCVGRCKSRWAPYH